MTQIPVSVADIRDRFRQQLLKLKTTAETASKASRGQGQRKWMQPDKGEWSGDLFDLQGIGKAFDRQENWDDYIKSVTQPGSGVIGDLQVSQLQGDWLATMERAYRTRMVSRCRAEQHSASRLYGHGHAEGLFKKSILGYVQGIVSNAKKQAR